MSELLTITEAMAFLKCARSTIYEMEKRGEIKIIRFGLRNCRIRKSDLEKLVS